MIVLRQTAVEYFGTQAAIAKALDIDPVAVSLWGEGVIPKGRATELHLLTVGQLAYDPSFYPKKKAVRQ